MTRNEVWEMIHLELETSETNIIEYLDDPGFDMGYPIPKTETWEDGCVVYNFGVVYRDLGPSWITFGPSYVNDGITPIYNYDRYICYAS